MKATEVFTPGAFPSATYVEREGARLEGALRDALETPGQIASLVGPSKSGKTVLVERVVGRDELITVTGAGIADVEDIWQRVLDWMGTPSSTVESRSTGGKVGVGGSVEGSAKIPFVAKGGASATASGEAHRVTTKSATHERTGLVRVTEEIANSDYVVLIDDFHYMPRAVQVEAAKSLKEAARLGVKICTAAVRHRGDDLVRANPELRGRVRAIDLEYWPSQDLEQIGMLGFQKLRVNIDRSALQELVAESAGSPQLMQLLCLNTCFVLNLRNEQVSEVNATPSPTQLEAVFEQASASTDFRSLVDLLDSGPKTRGTERKLYRFHDGTKGDVYRCVLKAVAANPPHLSHPYEDLTRRTNAICESEPPVGSSVTGTCHHMTRLAHETFPTERAIDWDEDTQVLDIPDPYLLFYLRWSGRLVESE